MPTLGAPLDCAKLEIKNERVHQLTTAPVSGLVEGVIYYNSTDHSLYVYNGTAWVGCSASPLATTSTTGTITLAGDLAGTAASPQIATGTLVLGDCNVSMSDAAAITASLRSLGRGAIQAMAGSHGLDTISAGVVSTNPISASSQRITSVADPTGAQDAATKNYVDTFAQGLDTHPSVHAATTANITTLAGGAPNTLDTITLAANDRVLVKDQTTTNQNGIYVVTTLGTGVNGTWTRATDQDTWAEVPSAYVWVEMGAVNADTGWTCTSDPGGTLGTTAITWTQFSSAGAAIAGAGLTKTGNTIDAVGTANRIVVGANSIDIDSGYVGQSTITTVGSGGTPVTSGVWNASPIAILYGGTGSTTAVGARALLGCAGVYTSATHGAGTSWQYSAATHGLGVSPTYIVQCQVDSTGVVVMPDVSISAGGLVTITFGVSQSANTIRTTIVG